MVGGRQPRQPSPPAAVEPLLRLGRITMVAEPKPPDQGGCQELQVGGTPVRVALLPFVSQRAIVRAEQLMANAAYENAQAYAERLRWVVDALVRPSTVTTSTRRRPRLRDRGPDRGRGAGGPPGRRIRARGRRLPTVGQLRRPRPPAPAPADARLDRHPLLRLAPAARLRGAGAGQEVNVVEAEPGIPAKVTPMPLRSGRRLRTLTGTVAQLAAIAESGDDRLDDWLRVRVAEPGRAGLADEVRDLLGERVVDVRIESVDAPDAAPPARAGRRLVSCSPRTWPRGAWTIRPWSPLSIRRAFADELRPVPGRPDDAGG